MPLLISGLLLATVTALWWMTYERTERILVTTAGARLQSAATSVGTMDEMRQAVDVFRRVLATA